MSGRSISLAPVAGYPLDVICDQCMNHATTRVIIDGLAIYYVCVDHVSQTLGWLSEYRPEPADEPDTDAYCAHCGADHGHRADNGMCVACRKPFDE